MKRGGPLKRTRLKPVSAKRLGERDARAAVREVTLRRAGFRCEAPGAFGMRCAGVLDVHETFPRGANPGSHLDASITMVLCRSHHRYVTDHPQEAHDAGLRFWSHERTIGPRATRSDPPSSGETQPRHPPAPSAE